MNEHDTHDDPGMDSAALYLEETITDRKVGTIRRMRPVHPDGSFDENRDTLYIGQAQLLTAVGPVPLSFEIEAKDLGEAVKNFGDAARVAVDQAMREIQDMRREAASSIVIPDAATGLGGPGGLPGGGKIQMP